MLHVTQKLRLGVTLHLNKFAALLSHLPANVAGMGVVPTVEGSCNSSERGVSVAALVPGEYASVA